MPLYTVWSRGRLLGTSDLGYRRVFRNHRMGDFHPTDVGLRVMPVATGVSPAGIHLAKMLAASPRPADGLLDDAVRQTSEYADFVAADNHREALALELRGPDGSLIPTEWIDIRDTEFLLSLASEDDPGIDGLEPLLGEDANEEPDADFEDDDECSPELWGATASWQPGDAPPRYQLQVMLRDDADVP